MKILQAKRFSDFQWLLIAALAFWLFPETVLPQEMAIPDYFLRLEDASKTLKPKIAAAQNRNDQTEQARKFWLGYRFDPRDDMESQHYYIHDGGGITISRGAEFSIYEDADLEAQVLHALSELGDEEAKARFKEKIVFAISQHDSKRAANVLIDIAENDGSREVRKKAIFWLGQIAGRKTLQALGDIVESADETEVKTKAVFAISQHQDKDLAFQMLKDIVIAKHNPNPRVRKKAIFWMGQMGDERAVDFFKDILTNND